MLILQEIVQFEHRGVILYVRLDYEKGKVSFVEKGGLGKQWLFKDRTREYLGGWWLIFEALQEATKYADTRLKEQAELREQIKEKKVIDMMIALSDIKEKKTKK